MAAIVPRNVIVAPEHVALALNARRDTDSTERLEGSQWVRVDFGPHHEHRASAVSGYRLRHGTHDDPPHALASVRSHDDEVDLQVARQLNDRMPGVTAGFVRDDRDPSELLVSLRQARAEPLEKLQARALLVRFVRELEAIDVQKMNGARAMLLRDEESLFDDGRRGLGVVDGHEYLSG